MRQTTFTCDLCGGSHQGEARRSDDGSNDYAENLPEGWDVREDEDGQKEDVCSACWDDYRVRLENARKEWMGAGAVKRRDRKKEEKTT